MKLATPLAALLLVLAGCSEETPASDDADVIVTTPDVNVTADPVSFTVDQTEFILQGLGAANVTGTILGDATITVAGIDATVSNGTWSVQVPVPFGHTTLDVLVDDGLELQNATVLVKRHMELTVRIDHDPAQGKQDREDTIYWDYGGLRSMHEDASYEGCAQPHPERPNAHDALLDYSDITGVPITYTDCGSFGVSVDDVDSIDYGPLGWCFTVNGEAAEFGISLLELQDGDVFGFLNCAGLS